MKVVDGNSQSPLLTQTSIFAALHVYSHVCSLPETFTRSQMRTVTKSGVYIHREPKSAFNTSEGCVSDASGIYQKANLYLLCVPSEAEGPAFDASAV